MDNRTVMEKAEFQLMLAATADLVLTAHVLILLDGSYASRFWTLTEAWCSMQTATPEGLRPATEAERRYTIKCIHNADDEHDAKGLVQKLSRWTHLEMYDLLKKPDVNVTNAKDKATMLPKILEIDGHVIETFQNDSSAGAAPKIPTRPQIVKLQTQTGRSFFSRKSRDEAQKELVDRAIKELRRQGWDDDAPSFYFLPAEFVRECRTKSLPRMQTLRDLGHLKKMKIPLASAFRAPAFHVGGIMANILFVSHRWEVPSKPDLEGVQLAAIKAYLEVYPGIEWVWFDYSSMPQGDDRTPEEKAEFQLMLSPISDLIMTAHVLILLDGSYASRFWTLTEAWMAMQTATPEGLRPATEAERRYTITCIHTATETTASGLVALVSEKTHEEMYHVLNRPGVNVTNAKDKEAMLPVLRKINEHVIEAFRNFSYTPPEPEGFPTVGGGVVGAY